MDKQNKGLADNHDGDIILNESGTSVSFGWDKTEDTATEENAPQQSTKEKDNNKPADKEDEGLISLR